ncbi:hypothetical protein [Agrococcus lahaulensis]|uniref:hypothetical protein n=1 Tax=Agrococcus lahaulensis TaxID=341722 RepID=UPI00047E0C13|nr:hypothetical protein [Agrococcus lahaulensis]
MHRELAAILAMILIALGAVGGAVFAALQLGNPFFALALPGVLGAVTTAVVVILRQRRQRRQRESALATGAA